MKFIKPASFYVFRKPALPIETLTDLFAIKDNSSFQEKLLQIVEDPAFQNALSTSSPSLYHQLHNLLQEEHFIKKEKILKTLLKYLIRMCSRPTPFGRFAGCTSPGYYGEKTTVSFDENAKRIKRLDARLLLEIQRFIVGNDEIKSQLKYFPNNSLYRIGEKLKYTYCSHQENARAYSLCSFQTSLYLDKVISASINGSSIQALSNSLVSDEIDYEMAESFIHELIDEQILVSELEFRVTGKSFLRFMTDKISGMRNSEQLVDMLKGLGEIVDGDGEEIEASEQIIKILDINNISINNKIVLQTDLFFPTSENKIKKKFVEGLIENLQMLRSINQAHYNADLESFKRRFLERYEGQEIPLMMALDPENGLGYGPEKNTNMGCLPLIDGIDSLQAGEQPNIEWNFWKSFLLRKYSDALSQSNYEIKLNGSDISYLEENNNKAGQLPGSFSAFGSIIASSVNEIDENEHLFYLNLVTGPSGANIVSRFCKGDEELNNNVENYLTEEEESYPDDILAEVIHLPEEVAGNIVVRPALRKYEIPFLASSSVDGKYQIALDDLMVSIKDGKEVIIRSKKLNKRIIPRLSSTHNFTKGLGVYKFLCDLQYDENYVNIRWHWSILEKQKFLPRVSFRNIILSCATWNLHLDQFPQLKGQNSETEAFFTTLKNNLKVPRYISLCESDNELMLDLENENCKLLLIDEFLKREQIILKEFLQHPDKCFLKDSRGSYPNEIVIPFQCKEAIQRSHNYSLTEAKPVRKFPLGSEWVYFKIYAGEKTVDKLLKKDLQVLTSELIEEGIIDKWFFCRFSDPDYHLRIRFHGDQDKEFYKETINRLYKVLDQYLHQGFIHKIQTDTYNREIERYGAESIELMEDLFLFDSKCILQFLNLLKHDSEEDRRWLFALKGVDSLLNDYNFNLPKKTKLIEFLFNNFSKEFAGIQNLKRQADEKFRANSKRIAKFLECDEHLDGMEFEMNSIIDQRSKLNENIVNEIQKINCISGERIDNLLISHIHMFLNRLFISKHRLHEYVIYHHLHKYYKGVSGKKKQETEEIVGVN